MVAKNNYYWTERLVAEEGADSYVNLPSFIANGDIAVIRRVRRQRELYGFRFEDAVLSFPDYDDLEMDVTLLLDTLHSEAPSLTHEESEKLFNNVMEDYVEIPNKKALRGSYLRGAFCPVRVRRVRARRAAYRAKAASS